MTNTQPLLKLINTQPPLTPLLIKKEMMVVGVLTTITHKFHNINCFSNLLRFATITLFSFLLVSCSDTPHELPEPTEDFCSRIHQNDTSNQLDKTLALFNNHQQQQTGVYVLEDGGGAMLVRAWLSEQAQKTIDVQYFIFSTDNVGLIACDYLVRAADKGIKVRILIDDMMVEAGIHELLTMNSHENIDIKIYNPGVNLGKNSLQKIKKITTDFRSANQRMHNKTFIVDEKVVITGGRNIADEYFDYDHEYNFRDRDVLLLGNVTKSVQQSFNEFWNHPLSVPVTTLVEEPGNDFSNPARFERLHQYACNPDNFWPQVRDSIQQLSKTFEAIQASGRLVWCDSVQFVSDVPGKNNSKTGLGGGGITTDTLIHLVKRAQVSIDIQSPYLITTDESERLFEEAIKRGVKIRILTNSLASTDNAEAFSGYQRVRDKLLKIGVSIYEFKPDAACRQWVMTGAWKEKTQEIPIFGLHAKTMVVDEKIAVIGTFNLDPRSANLNTECITVISSASIANQILNEMEEEFKPENAWAVTVENNPDSNAGRSKRLKAWSRKILPKGIL